jgi:2-polyprenyl-3-methyl-5-hydroxy-6-metoxy-1,4-benzoquinol methylase
MSGTYTYPGQELAFFEKAINWKSYFASLLLPYMGTNVLEVGSGIGATTALLNQNASRRWTLLEPDETMHAILEEKIRARGPFSNCILLKQTISGLDKKETFDTIIYIDVLEHIEDDKREMLLAVDLLKKGGHLMILSPAYPFLFSPFDKAIGHYRRYTANSLEAAMPPGLKPVSIRYLDSVGFFASLANKMFLQQKYPTEKQIRMWDKWMIPVSKTTDKIFFHSFGKSILGNWRKE